MSKRLKILEYSLKLENICSQILGYLLNVKDYQNSNSFGNKSSSLSFNQKINVLLDNDSITKDERTKLIKFMNIRNQFIHNINVKNYNDSISQGDGTDNWLMKKYPKLKTNFNEENLELAIADLVNDCFLILTSFKGGLQSKMNTESDAKFYKEIYKKFNSAFNENIAEFKAVIEKGKRETYSKEEVLVFVDALLMETSLNKFDMSIVEEDLEK